MRDGFTYDRKLPLEGYDHSRVIYVNHHQAHAASEFYASGFPEANIISLDGNGGSESGILGVWWGVNIEIIKAISNRGSWGLQYELITEKPGFRRHSCEGKVMGLAAYGTPDPNGLPFIKWDGDIPLIEPASCRNFINAIPARKKEDPITDYHKNLAATLQDSLERAVKRKAEYFYEETGIRRLCLAGCSALNCSMNGKLALISVHNSTSG